MQAINHIRSTINLTFEIQQSWCSPLPTDKLSKKINNSPLPNEKDKKLELVFHNIKSSHTMLRLYRWRFYWPICNINRWPMYYSPNRTTKPEVWLIWFRSSLDRERFKHFLLNSSNHNLSIFQKKISKKIPLFTFQLPTVWKTIITPSK